MNSPSFSPISSSIAAGVVLRAAYRTQKRMRWPRRDASASISYLCAFGRESYAYKDFNDVSDGYWAAAYIKAAAKHGWINGYGDGSFRADDEINRAEVVTIVNRLLGREADADYIADNLRKLNTFPDVSRKHWAYYAVMEAANAHTAILGDSESWSK